MSFDLFGFHAAFGIELALLGALKKSVVAGNLPVLIAGRGGAPHDLARVGSLSRCDHRERSRNSDSHARLYAHKKARVSVLGSPNAFFS
jgi:hypothetical protein